MSDNDQQRRHEILAEARATLARTKNIEQRHDDPMSPPRDIGTEWRQRATEREIERAQAQAERQLEQRLEEERAAVFDALAETVTDALATINDALTQAMAQQRKFALEAIEQAIAKLRSERDTTSQSPELRSELLRIWTSLTAAHEAIVNIQQERRAEIVAAERPATAKLN